MPTATGTLLNADYEVPEEERTRAAGRKEPYPQLVARLSHQSVVKHFDAYADIPWDDPAYRIDPEDPRWELSAEDVLGGTAWYRNQPQAVRARIGLHMMATFMKVGLQFEGVLKRGLLEFALELPNRSPEFRYAYHEVIEEAQHSLMFQEFVNRTGFDIPGLAWWQRLGSRQVIRFGRTFPELFFIFVLGGDKVAHALGLAHFQRTQFGQGSLDTPAVAQERREADRRQRIGIAEDDEQIAFVRVLVFPRVVVQEARPKPLLAEHLPQLAAAAELFLPDSVLQLFEQRFLAVGFHTHIPAD